MPDSRFKTYWNLIITLLLLYTASFVPYRIAFIDDNPTAMIVADTIMDMLFLGDIFVNLVSAYEDKKVGLEVRHKQIAIKYMKSWLFLDVLSW